MQLTLVLCLGVCSGHEIILPAGPAWELDQGQQESISRIGYPVEEGPAVFRRMSSPSLKLFGAKFATFSGKAFGAIDNEQRPVFSALAETALTSPLAKSTASRVAQFTLNKIGEGPEGTSSSGKNFPIRDVDFPRLNPEKV